MINNVNSVWISANAGSGKTTALTERVVRLMLLGAEPERICCITYTKAAASEMRARVLKYLRDKLMLATAEARHATITPLLGVPPTEEIDARAQALFGRVLDSIFGGPQLTTIHGFCQNLLQRFPLEAGIAPYFTVLDEAAAENLLRLARHRVLSGGDAYDTPTNAALALIGERLGEQRFGQLMQAISQQRRWWEPLWKTLTPPLLQARLQALHGIEGVLETALTSDFCALPDAETISAIHAILPQWQTHAADKADIFANWFEADAATRLTQIDALCGWLLTDKGTPRVKHLPKELGKDELLAGLLQRWALQAQTFCDTRAALACAEESLAIALLAREFLGQYEQAKTQAQALDYDDLIAATQRLLANPEMLGWVVQKLDHRIDHLLIDEAQDTSGAQWGIAQALVEELIANAGGIGSGGLPRSLLVVGDEKQSIYSFQGAAPELFSSKHATFYALLAGSDAPLAAQSLETSYRSAAAILQLVDAVAAQPAIAHALSASGATPIHKLARSNAAGLVRLHAPIHAVKDEKLPPLQWPMDYPARSSVAETLAQTIAVAVRTQLDQGRAPADILILLQQRGALMGPLIRTLERHHVPIAGLDRLVLSEHLAVRDVLALMAWCINPADDLACAQVLRSPLLGWTDDQLRAAAFDRPGTLAQAVDLPELARWRALRDASPYTFLTTVLEVDGAREKFAARFGAEVQEVLDELKAQAAAMPATMPPTLTHFHDWLSASRRQIKREVEGAGAQAVRVMTVHGAKGLEAPVVMIADMARLPTTQKEPIFFTRDAHGQLLPVLSLSDAAKAAPALVAAKEEKKAALVAEYQRLLYVALTRARDELHVFGVANAKGEVHAESWYARVRDGLRALGATADSGGLLLVNSGSSMPVTQAPEPHHEPLPVWARAPVAPMEHDNTAITAPSRLVGAGAPSPYATQGNKGAKERGVRIHRLLEWLQPTTTAAELGQMMRTLVPDWSEAEQQAAMQEIWALRSAHGWLWAGKRFVEPAITGTILMDGVARTVSGQLDLLVDTGDAWVIVDYKTGKNIPHTPSDVSLNYRWQLKIYRALVAALYPGRPIKTAILWSAQCQLMWLDDVLEITPWDYQNVMLDKVVAA